MCYGNLKILRESLQEILYLPNKLYPGNQVTRKDVIKRAALLPRLDALQRNLSFPPIAITSVLVEHAGTKKDQWNFTVDDCKLFARGIGQQIRSLCRVAAQLLRKKIRQSGSWTSSSQPCAVRPNSNIPCCSAPSL